MPILPPARADVESPQVDLADSLSLPLRAALRQFSTVGYHGTSVRDIANDLNMTPAGLYYHFVNKEAILSELLEKSAEYLLAICQEARDSAQPYPDAQFVAVVQSVIAFVVWQRDLTLIAQESRSLSGAGKNNYFELRRNIQHLVQSCVQAGMDAHLFDVEDPATCARALMGMLQSIPSWYRIDSKLKPHEVVRQFTLLSLRLVNASSAVITSSLAPDLPAETG